MTLGWLLLVAAIIAWGWARPDPGAGRACWPRCSCSRANQLGAGRSEEDVVIPVIGRRVTRAPRLSAGAEPIPGGED